MRDTRHSRNVLRAANGPRVRRRGLRQRRRAGPALLRLLTIAVAVVALAGVWVLARSIFGADPVRFQVVDALTGEPVPGVTVRNERGASATTDDDGWAGLRFTPPHRLSASAAGYRDATFQVDEIPRQAALTLTINPYILQGRVTDDRGVGLVGVTVTAGARSTTSGEFGSYELVGVDPGPVVASKAAWEATETHWEGDPGRFDITLEPFVVKGLRVGHSPAASPERLADIYRMIEGTVVNAIVFDTKFEDGRVFHEIDVPLVREADALAPFFDARALVEDAKARGYYTITRIATFQDDYVTELRPEWAIRDSETGEMWTTFTGHRWLDPTNRATWQYPIDLGIHACRLGFDEIQYDYVRFPSDGPTGRAVYSIGAIDAETRVATIAAFLAEAREAIHAEGCAVSADVFAIIFSATNDQGIGQKVEELSWVVDVLSPMIYPSHYGPGWLGLDNPNNHPARVVGQALEAGMPRVEGGALVRPWLQAFAWTAAQVRESIAEADRHSSAGWLLWNSGSVYEREYFPTR